MKILQKDEESLETFAQLETLSRQEKRKMRAETHSEFQFNLELNRRNCFLYRDKTTGK